jgi:hypothetical protein
VNIDTARPPGSNGMTDAILALKYDPNLFDVSAEDVQLGTVAQGSSGWNLQTEINSQTGQIGIELYSNTPIHSADGGSLVTITMHPRTDLGVLLPAPALSLVPYVDPAGGPHTYQTSVADAQGEFVVHVTQAPGVLEPATPEVVGITGQTPNVANEPVGPSTFDVQQPVVATSTASQNVLPLAVVDKVFSGLDQVQIVLQDSTLVQLGAMLASESDAQSSNEVRDLTLLRTPAGVPQPEWLPDDYLAFLGQPARRGQPAMVADLLNDAALGLENDNLGGFDAVFARANGKRSQ